MVDKEWGPKFDWTTPAGEVLWRLIDHLHARGTVCEITVFGSAVLQMSISPNFLSNDVDFFASRDLSKSIRELGLEKGQSAFYIDQTPPNVFRTCPDWGQRAITHQEKLVKVVLPHPLDILVSKIKRLEEKDIRAFKMVHDCTGHPQEAELIKALQSAVDIYAPGFDEENTGGDPLTNTRILWRELYNKGMDPRKEIIMPALEQRRLAYGENIPDQKNALADRVAKGEQEAGEDNGKEGRKV